MSDAAPEASNSTAPAEEASVSALRDNIETKGKNAYYYAHSHKADGPAWDGKPGECMLTGQRNYMLCLSGFVTGGLCSSVVHFSFFGNDSIYVAE